MIRHSLVLFALTALLLASVPAFSQGSSSDYRNKYPGGRAKSAPYWQQDVQTPNTFSPAPTYSGTPSPENLPNANQKGFGQNSHWLERPGATGNIDALSKQVDDCMAKRAQAKRSGNMPGMFQANAAMQNVLRQLVSMEPQNAKWKLLKAHCYVVQSGGPSRSGKTAGDRFTLQQAIRELDMAAACPNSRQYMSDIQSMRSSADAELKKRIARGKEIGEEGRRFVQDMSGCDSGSSGGGPSWCTVCGKMHGGGGCTYRRD